MRWIFINFVMNSLATIFPSVARPVTFEFEQYELEGVSVNNGYQFVSSRPLGLGHVPTSVRFGRAYKISVRPGMINWIIFWKRNTAWYDTFFLNIDGHSASDKTAQTCCWQPYLHYSNDCTISNVYAISIFKTFWKCLNALENIKIFMLFFFLKNINLCKH